MFGRQWTGAVAAVVMLCGGASAQAPRDLFGTYSDQRGVCEPRSGDGGAPVQILSVTPTALLAGQMHCRLGAASHEGLRTTLAAACRRHDGPDVAATVTVDRRDAGAILLTVSGPDYFPAGGRPMWRCSSTPPTPIGAARSFWNHNGSAMMMIREGSRVRLVYEEPREGMVRAGATKGSEVFSGTLSGTTIRGDAVIFNSRCGQFRYPVSGWVDQDGWEFVMTGRAPRIGRDCRPASWIDDTLRFEILP